ELCQAALLATRRLLGGARFLGRKEDVRPVERWEAQSRLLAVRDGEGAQGPAVECTLERHDEAALAVLRRHDAIQEHRLDRVFDRLGAGVNDEVARGAARRDAV